MEFKDVLSAIFSKTEWKKVSETEKYSNFFMINRFLSIKYPVEINSCQIVGLGKKNSARMLDCWNIILSSKYTRLPPWIWTKGGSKDKIKDCTKDIDKSIIKKFQTDNQLSQKDLDFYAEMFPDDFRKDLLHYKKITAQLVN
jgi:hypothetical protein